VAPGGRNVLSSSKKPTWLIDANVIVSAALSSGPPRELLLEAEHGSFQAIVTPYILAQVHKALVDKLGFKASQVDALLRLLPATTVPDPSPDNEVMQTAQKLFRDRDPADAPVLAAALKADADAIITGDHDFFIPEVQAKVLVLSPSEALALCRSAAE